VRHSDAKIPVIEQEFFEEKGEVFVVFLYIRKSVGSEESVSMM
jgi:hypothetical protein